MKLTEDEKRKLREEMKEAAKKMNELLDKSESREADDEKICDDANDSDCRGTCI